MEWSSWIGKSFLSRIKSFEGRIERGRLKKKGVFSDEKSTLIYIKQHLAVLSLSMLCTSWNMSQIISLKKHSVYAARAAADKKVEWDCALLHRQRVARGRRPSLEFQREGKGAKGISTCPHDQGADQIS